MSKNQKILMSSLLLIYSVSNSVVAEEDAPPPIPDNPGVPGLLAQIDELESELAATQEELAETQSELTETQAELAEALADLEEANSLLAAALEELIRERSRFRVPQTGQNQCWDAPTNDPDDPHAPVSCADSGQDGDKRAGLEPPAGRFVDNGDGSITDRFTRLVWLKNANCLSVDWETAVDLAGVFSGNATVPLCNLTDDSHLGDWRLPNVFELMSLLSYEAASFNGPSLPPDHPFTDLSGYYWTSTTYALDEGIEVAGVIYPCRRQGYPDNRLRFNDAYVVNVNTAEVVRLPKESGEEISKRHKSAGGGSCTGQGFASGSPADSPYAFPSPRFIVVRDAVE